KDHLLPTLHVTGEVLVEGRQATADGRTEPGLQAPPQQDIPPSFQATGEFFADGSQDATEEGTGHGPDVHASQAMPGEWTARGAAPGTHPMRPDAHPSEIGTLQYQAGLPPRTHQGGGAGQATGHVAGKRTSPGMPGAEAGARQAPPTGHYANMK